MNEKSSDNETQAGVRNRRVHMANERTFLAWIRTSIGIMAFGFVVEKFALFVRQFSHFINTAGLNSGYGVMPADHVSQQQGISSFLGVALVGLGAVMGLLAFVRFKKVEKQIEEGAYRPSKILDALLTLSVLAIGLFLVVYLYHNM
ncbi:MAG TPA: DUF202 domain-containing protein [Dissulfurispiraceae bacterium]|nr:DUF202 domain-containing protein [Dissulfurispiraceae bacterium]